MTGKRLAGRLVPALLVMPLLVLAACGQNNRNSAASVDKVEAARAYAQCIRDNGSDPATVEQMRQFSQCMRDNGLPDYPDPDPDGQLRGPGHEQQDNPIFRAAMETCRQQLPGGGDHR